MIKRPLQRIFIATLLAVAGQLHAQDIEQMLHAKPAEFYGGISAYTEWYRPEGIDPRGGTFNWGLSGNAGVRLYGWDIPFSFSFGRQRTNFNYPIYNQFGISPKYKWLTIHLGHRNLHFSPYTLAGHTIQGAGFEITPGKLRMAAIAGNLRKPFEVRPEDLYEFLPAYRRKGYAFKVGVGTERNYVDLIFFRAQDDSTSIENPFHPELRPGTNTVMGINLRRQLGKSLHLELESGLSVLTRDRASDALLENQDENFWSRLFDLRYTTRINMALRGALEYHKGKWRTRLGYDRIDPEYESMGTYYFANDVENIVLGISGPLNNIISLQANAGMQRNNLLETRYTSTARFVGSINADIHPAPLYGMNISYSNFNISQRASLVPLNDSARLSNVSHTLMLAPRYTISKGERLHTMTATWMHQFLKDRNPAIAHKGNFTSTFISLMYIYLPNAKHQFSLGVHRSMVRIADQELGQVGTTLGYQFLLSEKNLSAGLQGSWQVPSGKTESSGNNLYLTANTSFQIKKLQCTVYYQFLTYHQPPVADYNENRAGLSLSYFFR